MLDNHNNRNLSDVFKELQKMQTQQTTSSNNENLKAVERAERAESTKKHNNNYNYTHNNKYKTYYKSSDLKLSHIIIGCSILIVGLAVCFPKNVSFTQSYAMEDNEIKAESEYELNRHRLNMQNIISENAEMDRVKEQVTEEREVEFQTQYHNNPSLPKSEEVLKQEGVLGKDSITAIKTYENGNFVEEIILDRKTVVEPTPKIIDLGTSEFLAKHKVHIGDIMYFIDTANIKEKAEDASPDVAEVKQYLDVKLLELPSEDWCKVSFDGIEGFVKTSALTSPTTTPNIEEKNRIQKILLKVNSDMELNRVSGLTLNDYKKIFTGISEDTNKIFEDNYTAFYNAEKKYNINGIFLASIAAHESGWGSSQIAKDKKNLFGYGSYDSTPYESSFGFNDYSEGIETVAKSLVKYYINPAGTKIYDGETAVGTYYNGPTLNGVNTRYASDTEWHNKVFSYMQKLYNKLK